VRIRNRALFFGLGGWVSGLVGLATLPLVTLALGPEEYGLFATGNAVASLIGSVLSAPFAFIFAAARGRANASGEIRAAVLAATMLGIAALLAFAGLAVILPETVADAIGLPISLYLLALLPIPVMPIWIAAVDQLTLDGRAFTFFLIVLLQVLIGAGVTLWALFGLDLHAEALFLGNLAGHAVMFAGALYSLRKILIAPQSAAVGDYWRLLASAAPAQVVDAGHTPIDRIWIAASRNSGELGILAHAATYQSMALGVGKAISRAVWPMTLDEARANPSSMPVTRVSSALIHFIFGALGIAIAAVGFEAINFISNGKFGEAAVFASALVAVLLVQHAGRNAMGVAYSQGKGAALSRNALVAGIVGIAVSLVAIPLFGAAGSILGMFARFAVFRTQLYLCTRGLGLAFQDGWIVAGLVAIAATGTARAMLSPGLTVSLVLCAAALLAWMVAGTGLFLELRRLVKRRGVA
jgi:O-antigen/teichoic acid export membrane protein